MVRAYLSLYLIVIDNRSSLLYFRMLFTDIKYDIAHTVYLRTYFRTRYNYSIKT